MLRISMFSRTKYGNIPEIHKLVQCPFTNFLQRREEKRREEKRREEKRREEKDMHMLLVSLSQTCSHIFHDLPSQHAVDNVS